MRNADRARGGRAHKANSQRRRAHELCELVPPHDVFMPSCFVRPLFYVSAGYRRPELSAGERGGQARLICMRQTRAYPAENNVSDSEIRSEIDKDNFISLLEKTCIYRGS